MRLLIVEDELWVRRALADVIRAGDPSIDVVTSGTGEEALRLVAGAPPDIALVDLGLPGISGVHVIAGLRRGAPRCVPLAFTNFDDAPTILAALEAGARGYLLKSTPSDRVVPLIREALAGGLPLSPAVASLVVANLLSRSTPQAEAEVLTERETELLALLARGATYAQCASALGIGVGTVQSYVKNIYSKLEISSKAEAAVAAVRLGLVR